MIVINLFGGPGSGKSTTAAALFVHLKNKAISSELVGEEAKDQIYWGSSNQLSNQFLLAALQYARLKNLESAGCKIAIADSPLVQSPMYAKNSPYYTRLENLVWKVNSEFENYNILIRRTKPYSTFGRTQKNESDAKVIDELIKQEFTAILDVEISGDQEGQEELCKWIDKRTQKGDDVEL